MFNKFKKHLLILGVILSIGLVFVSYIWLDGKEVKGAEVLTTNTTTTLINDSFSVDVKGAVKKPGVYEFRTGERVIDAISKAGGLTKSADTSNINLSKKLTEEMVVYIFKASEISKGTSKVNACPTKCEVETITINNCIPENDVNNSNTENNNSEETNNKVNINTADLTKLMTLPGIGESKAKAIIEYRTTNGLFSTIEDITKVSGIGQSTFENLKSQITV